MSKVLNKTLAVRNPETLEAVALVEGSELPDWATDLVHADDLGDGGSGDGASSYSGMKKAELEAEVEKRNADRDDADKVVVEGKGTVADLVAALEADDEG